MADKPEREQADVCPQGINTGMGDVQDTQDPIDHRQPKGNKGIDTAYGNSIGELLPEHIKPFEVRGASHFMRLEAGGKFICLKRSDPQVKRSSTL